MISETDNESQEKVKRPKIKYESSFDVTTVPVLGRADWISFDTNKAPGTPAKAYVTVSDTLGLRVVADFFGFWDKNVTLNNTLLFDRPEIPDTYYFHVIKR